MKLTPLSFESVFFQNVAEVRRRLCRFVIIPSGPLLQKESFFITDSSHLLTPHQVFSPILVQSVCRSQTLTLISRFILKGSCSVGESESSVSLCRHL